MDTSLNFTRKQTMLITSAIASVAFAVIVALVVAIVYYGNAFVSKYDVVLLPPVAAIIIAKVLQPLFEAIRRSVWRVIPAFAKRKCVRVCHGIATGLATVLVLAVVFVPIFLFFRYFGPLVWKQLSELPGMVKNLLQGGWEKIPRLKEYTDKMELTPIVNDAISRIDLSAVLKWSLAKPSISVMRGIPVVLSVVSGWAMVPVYLAVFLAARPFEGNDVSKILLGLSERTRRNIAFLIDEFIRIVVLFFRGQVLVALIEGVLIGLGLQFFAHLNYGLLLGMLAGLVGIIPYMGSVFVMPGVCLYAYFGTDDGICRLLATIAVWFAVGVADFFITAKIQGNSVGLSNFAVIFSLVFWSAVLGGFAGLFLAVPLTAFVVVFWRLIKREYVDGAGNDLVQP